MTTVAPSHSHDANACLMLADGKQFMGYGIGASGSVIGEICFNTAMTGYQEVLTDPSYVGQIIIFTFPHIGNTGCNPEDIEALRTGASGLVLREPITEPSNWRADIHFNDWLIKHNITGITGVDTRALTRYVRTHGAQNAVISFAEQGNSLDTSAMQARLKDFPSLKGMELSRSVTTGNPYNWSEQRWKHGKGYPTLGQGRHHVVAIDFGEKLNILRSLAERDCRITVVPAASSVEDILALKPDGVFLSNGPGDPAATGVYAVPVIQALLKQDLPIFGICLGHQLLALALGAKTEKMHQGHRGANHPVKNLETGAVEITSQNHGFCVTHESLPSHVEATHISLFDNCLEGFRVKDKPVFAVQYHPESSPGPHDSQYLFDRFVSMMGKE